MVRVKLPAESIFSLVRRVYTRLWESCSFIFNERWEEKDRPLCTFLTCEKPYIGLTEPVYVRGLGNRPLGVLSLNVSRMRKLLREEFCGRISHSALCGMRISHSALCGRISRSTLFRRISHSALGISQRLSLNRDSTEEDSHSNAVFLKHWFSIQALWMFCLSTNDSVSASPGPSICYACVVPLHQLLKQGTGSYRNKPLGWQRLYWFVWRQQTKRNDKGRILLPCQFQLTERYSRVQFSHH
jgi:hypothetical protein